MTDSALQESRVLRDRHNDILLTVPSTATAQHSPIRKPLHLPNNKPAAVAQDRRAAAHLLRQQSKAADDQHVRIKEAIAKQKVKRMSALFVAWKGAAHEGRVNLQGAARMLQWRKLLRIWKACLLLSTASAATAVSCTAATAV